MIIEYLAQQWPESVYIKSKNSHPRCLPLEWALHGINTSVETIAFLMKLWPEAVKDKDPDNNETYLLKALYCKGWNIKIISLLIKQWPEAVRIPDKNSSLPLHIALEGNRPLAVLKLLLKMFPDAVQIPDSQGNLPLHLVFFQLWKPAKYFQVIKLLMEYWPKSIQQKTDNGMLPLHLACKNMGRACLDIIWYIFHLYPYAVRVPEARSHLPLHILCARRTVPKNLVQCFVHEWPASVQIWFRWLVNIPRIL